MRFLRYLIPAFIGLLSSCNPVFASIIPSIPYTLTNGSLADATQVMGNFNTIVTDVNNSAAKNGANSDITSLTGLTTPLANTYGGTVVYTGGTTGGSANVQTLASVAPSNYSNTAGNIVTGIAGYTNSSAATLAVNSQTAEAIDVEDGAGLHALVGGEIYVGNSYTFYYDGTEYVLLNPSVISAGKIPSSVALAGSPTTTTQSAADNSTKIATTAYVDNATSAVKPAPAAITGFLPSSITGSSTTASMTISAGTAADSTNAAYITNASTESWAVSNGNAANGYSGGTTLPSSSTIHMYECKGASGVTSYAIPNSGYPLSAGSCPTGYTSYARRVFSFNTASSTTGPFPYTAVEVEGGGIIAWLATPVLDISITNLISANRAAQTLASVPLGIKVEPKILAQTDTTGVSIWLSSPDEPDVAPAAVATTPLTPQWTIAASNSTGEYLTFPWEGTTNTSAQIYARAYSGTSNHLYITTRGWKDFRRN